jgi:hypothetical protein
MEGLEAPGLRLTGTTSVGPAALWFVALRCGPSDACRPFAVEIPLTGTMEEDFSGRPILQPARWDPVHASAPRTRKLKAMINDEAGQAGGLNRTIKITAARY